VRMPRKERDRIVSMLFVQRHDNDVLREWIEMVGYHYCFITIIITNTIIITLGCFKKGKS
jgi:hypothetical protein